MTDFKWLLEDGGFWELEDSSGSWLTELQEVHGIEVSGTQSQQLIQRKITKFIPTDDLIINICAGLITNVGIRLPAFGQKLLPAKIFTERLRQSFIIPKGKLKEKGKKYLKSRMRGIQIEEFIEKWGDFGVLTMAKEWLKRQQK